MTDYTLVPQPGDQRNSSQVTILSDFTYLQTSVGHDHNFTNTAATANDGLHKQSTYFVGATPATTTAQVAVFAKNDVYNIPQLWVQPANSGVTYPAYQLSAGNPEVTSPINTQVPQVNNTAPATPFGITYLPGGLLLQFATVVTGDGLTVTFPVTFNTSVGFTPIVLCNDLLVNGFSSCHAQSITNTNFVVSLRTSTVTTIPSPRTINYIAIGLA
jgi:hypothetical protein